MKQTLTSYTLLRQATSRDEQAWSRLVTLYSPMVYRWCRRGGINGEDIHDVVQEVFHSIFGTLGQFDNSPGPGSFRKWVRTITRFRIADFYRQNGETARGQGGTQALRLLHEVPGVVVASDLEESAEETRELYLRVLELLQKDFEERTWRAFWRTVVDNHPVNEVALELGMTAMGVRQCKSRVLRRIKEELGELCTAPTASQLTRQPG